MGYRIPMVAAYCSFFLPGFGVTYATLRWRWFFLSFLTTITSFALLYPAVTLGSPPRFADVVNDLSHHTFRHRWVLLCFILCGINAAIAFLVAVRINQALGLRPYREEKDTAVAGLFNLAAPGLGVVYALDDIRAGCVLKYWEWGLLNIVIAVMAWEAGVPAQLIFLFNFGMGYTAALAASEEGRKKLGWSVDERLILLSPDPSSRHHGRQTRVRPSRSSSRAPSP